MNIVTSLPTTPVFTPTTNFNTESARRDNQLREVIPATTDAEQGAAKQGLGGESDRARAPGQLPVAVTYERPQVANAESPGAALPQSTEQSPDNASDQSAGKEGAQERQQQGAQPDAEQEKEIKALEARDAEVRQHEQAHANRGGQYAASPQYEFETGPDGKRYATGGEVTIDVSEAESAQKTIEKMQQVRAAALAPAEPSAQDYKVAREATQKEAEARQALNAENNSESRTPAATSKGFVRLSDQHTARVDVIQGFYRGASTPRDAGFSASA